MDAFAYQITSEDYIKPFMVSVESLREHHGHPVVVVLSKNCWHLEDEIQKLDPFPWSVFRSSYDMSGLPFSAHCKHKFLTYRKGLSIFSRLIYLDCDTIVAAPISDLFTDGLTLCRLESGQIQCGVVAFGRDSWAFMQLCMEFIAGRQTIGESDHDQYAFNAMAPDFAFVRYVDDEYNRCNAGYSDRTEWRVRHLHSKEFLRHDDWLSRSAGIRCRLSNTLNEKAMR